MAQRKVVPCVGAAGTAGATLGVAVGTTGVVRTAGAVGAGVSVVEASGVSRVLSPRSPSGPAVAVGVAVCSDTGQPARTDRIISARTYGRIIYLFCVMRDKGFFPFRLFIIARGGWVVKSSSRQNGSAAKFIDEIV